MQPPFIRIVRPRFKMHTGASSLMRCVRCLRTHHHRWQRVHAIADALGLAANGLFGKCLCGHSQRAARHLEGKR